MYLYVKESEYMKPTIKNYVFLHVAFLIYSIIMVYMKWAAQFPVASISFFIAYFGLVVLLFGYAILWQQVIKNFEISRAYSHRGIIILWSMLWSVFLFGDTIQWNHILGAAIIIVGIVVVTKMNSYMLLFIFGIILANYSQILLKRLLYNNTILE